MANRIQYATQDAQGNLTSGVAVEVRDSGTGTLIDLFSDSGLTVAVSNPGVSDGDGFFDVWCSTVHPVVSITAGAGASSRTLNDVFIGSHASVMDNDSFTGDGSTAEYLLGAAPLSPDNVLVFVDGIMQDVDSYSLSGETLIFSEAPPLNSNIEIRRFQVFSISVELPDQPLNTNIAFANGNGIDFSATSGTGTSELFDDYEEGTWTPVVAGLTTAGTYELQKAVGKYTKVGDLVTIEAFIQLAAAVTGGGAGNLGITGVPFAKPADAYSAAAAYVALVTISETPIVTWSAFGASSTLVLQQNASGGYGTSVAITDVTNNSYISFSLTYKVA